MQGKIQTVRDSFTNSAHEYCSAFSPSLLTCGEMAPQCKSARAADDGRND